MPAILYPLIPDSFLLTVSGCFKFTLRKVKDAYYYKFCLVGDSDYASVIKEITLVGLERNAKILFFSLSKLADFTINIYRKSKTPALDTLFMSWKSAGIDGRFLYPYKIINHVPTTDFEAGWVGGKVKSTIQTRAFADKETEVRFVLYRNGKMREIIDTITCKRNVKNSVYFTY